MTVAPWATTWGTGLAVWVVSAGWLTAVEHGVVGPRKAGRIAACAGLFAAAEVAVLGAAGYVLGVVTVALLGAAGIALRHAWLLAVGALAGVVVLPQTAYAVLPNSAAAPCAVLAAGLLLVGLAVWLARRVRVGVRRSPGR